MLDIILKGSLMQLLLRGAFITELFTMSSFSSAHPIDYRKPRSEIKTKTWKMSKSVKFAFVFSGKV